VPRYLAIDLGEKRTGLAVGDSVLRIASPLEVIEVPSDREAGAALVAEIARSAASVGADVLVVGLPLNMDGTEGPRAKAVRTLAAMIGAKAGRPVLFHDERLSTARADWQMARTGMTRGEKKGRRDAIAAAAILQEFLDAPAKEG